MNNEPPKPIHEMEHMADRRMAAQRVVEALVIRSRGSRVKRPRYVHPLKSPPRE